MRKLLLQIFVRSPTLRITSHSPLLATKPGRLPMTCKQWISNILSLYGPKLHVVLKQLIDPQPFPSKSWLECVDRLSVSLERIDAHPCEELSHERLDIVRETCASHLKTTGIELRPHRSPLSNMPLSSSSQRPPAPLCRHCNERGHHEDKCWQKYPSLCQRSTVNAADDGLSDTSLIPSGQHPTIGSHPNSRLSYCIWRINPRWAFA